MTFNDSSFPSKVNFLLQRLKILKIFFKILQSYNILKFSNEGSFKSQRLFQNW